MGSESPTQPPHQGLRILLNVLGVMCLVKALGLFLPSTWLHAMMDFGGRALGGPGAGTVGPVFWYTARLWGPVCIGIAWMSFAAARDPERYRQFINAVMVTLAAWVVLCPVFAYSAGVPLVWSVEHSVFSLILLLLFLALYPRRAVAAE